MYFSSISLSLSPTPSLSLLHILSLSLSLTHSLTHSLSLSLHTRYCLRCKVSIMIQGATAQGYESCSFLSAMRDGYERLSVTAQLSGTWEKIHSSGRERNPATGARDNTVCTQSALPNYREKLYTQSFLSTGHSSLFSTK